MEPIGTAYSAQSLPFHPSVTIEFLLDKLVDFQNCFSVDQNQLITSALHWLLISFTFLFLHFLGKMSSYIYMYF